MAMQVQMKHMYLLYEYDNLTQVGSEIEYILLNENPYHFLQMAVVVVQKQDYIKSNFEISIQNDDKREMFTLLNENQQL